ncbi:MAG: sugar O-acetyltransferase [Bacillota bacterium]
MDEKSRMINGKLYMMNEGLFEQQSQAKILIKAYNKTKPNQLKKRKKLLVELLGKTGKSPYIEPSFFCDYGKNITVGDNFYANTGCIVLDSAPVTIGNQVMFGPRVSLFTATHPIDAGVRNRRLEYAKPITIGNGVWIGGDVTINPGVTVGDNAIIGAGSVVTKAIPPNVIATGNPCKVIREITKEDKSYWEAQEQAYHKSQ